MRIGLRDRVAQKQLKSLRSIIGKTQKSEMKNQLLRFASRPVVSIKIPTSV